MGARSPSPHERGSRAEVSQLPVVPCLQGKGITRKEKIMRVFVTGAPGALGRYLVPGLREAGAEPVVLDGLDREAVIAAVLAAAPEVIVHEMTALAGMRSLRNPDKLFAVTNELRAKGTDNLLAAAKRAGPRRATAAGSA